MCYHEATKNNPLHWVRVMKPGQNLTQSDVEKNWEALRTFNPFSETPYLDAPSSFKDNLVILGFFVSA
jgi:hypothetical protein